MDWKDRTFSMDVLWQRTEYHFQSMPVMEWLRDIGVIPRDVVWTRRNALTKTSLDPKAIRAGYLAELAYEWDEYGGSTIGEFLDALEFEIAGHDKNGVVSEVLGRLGR